MRYAYSVCTIYSWILQGLLVWTVANLVCLLLWEHQLGTPYIHIINKLLVHIFRNTTQPFEKNSKHKERVFEIIYFDVLVSSPLSERDSSYVILAKYAKEDVMPK